MPTTAAMTRVRARDRGAQRSAVELVERVGADPDGEEEGEHVCSRGGRRRPGPTRHDPIDDVREVPQRVRRVQQRPPVAQLPVARRNVGGRRTPERAAAASRGRWDRARSSGASAPHDETAAEAHRGAFRRARCRRRCQASTVQSTRVLAVVARDARAEEPSDVGTRHGRP